MSNTNGDYISREAAIAAVHEHFDGILVYDESGETAANEIEDILLGLTPFIPIVSRTDVRSVVRGHWVWNPNGMDWGLGAWCCDQCRIKAETWWANDRRNNPLRCSGGRFCGNCGADMRPEPPAETPAPICQTCGNFETCPWRHEGVFCGPKDKVRRVVGCSDYKDAKG